MTPFDPVPTRIRYRAYVGLSRCWRQ